MRQFRLIMFNDHFPPVSLESSLSCKGSEGFKKEFTVKSDFQHNQIWDIELHASIPLQLLTKGLTEAIWCDQSSQLPNTQLLSPSVRFFGGDEANNSKGT